MAYFISDDCVGCGACESACPNECIKEADGKYVIDEECCVDCGACENVCGVGAAQPKQ